MKGEVIHTDANPTIDELLQKQTDAFVITGGTTKASSLTMEILKHVQQTEHPVYETQALPTPNRAERRANARRKK